MYVHASINRVSRYCLSSRSARSQGIEHVAQDVGARVGADLAQQNFNAGVSDVAGRVGFGAGDEPVGVALLEEFNEAWFVGDGGEALQGLGAFLGSDRQEVFGVIGDGPRSTWNSAFLSA